MYQTPSPLHGYRSVIVAFWLYIGAAVAVTVGLRALGVGDDAPFGVFIAVSLLLLPAFVPVFRRLTPDQPD